MSRRSYDLIVFDWDGTLMDSTATIVHCIQAACRDLDVVEPTDHAARAVIGLGLEEALATAVPHLPRNLYPELAARYRYHYLCKDHELVLFDGASDMVQGLLQQDYLLAVATGKTRKGLDRVLDLSGLRSCFHDTRCADETRSKPHPDMLHELMDGLGVEAGRTLMIGDTTHDLNMARNAGADGLGVSFGAHTHDELMSVPSQGIVHSMQELSAWLMANA